MEIVNISPISVSIFYNRSSWHHLITKLIKPFLKTEQNNGLIYYIYLNTYRGDHIKLVLQSSQHHDKLKKRISALLKEFLAKNQSQTKTITYPLPGFFMDYPNNSVLFDPGKPIVFPVIDTNGGDMQQHISQALAEALGNEEIDMESIYTFIVYMQMGIIKAAYSDIKEASVKAAELVRYLDNQEEVDSSLEMDITPSEYGDQRFKQLFEPNQDILLEIVKDIWKPGGYDLELIWMDAWEKSCRDFLNKSNFQFAFILLSKLIYEHMGFMSSTNLLPSSLKIISASLA